MTKSALVLIIQRVMEDFDLDDRYVNVDDFANDLATAIEYETDLEFENEDEENLED